MTIMVNIIVLCMYIFILVYMSYIYIYTRIVVNEQDKSIAL